MSRDIELTCCDYWLGYLEDANDRLAHFKKTLKNAAMLRKHVLRKRMFNLTLRSSVVC